MYIIHVYCKHRLQPDDTSDLYMMCFYFVCTVFTTVGFGAFSWETGSVPSGLVEIQASALTDFQFAQKIVAEGGLNDTAIGDSLTLNSQQVYDNTRYTGLTTIGFVRITDTANAGPYTFQATSTSFSVGPGGLLFNGLYAAATGLPSNPAGLSCRFSKSGITAHHIGRPFSVTPSWKMIGSPSPGPPCASQHGPKQ